jgi:hypothetical protein
MTDLSDRDYRKLASLYNKLVSISGHTKLKGNVLEDKVMLKVRREGDDFYTRPIDFMITNKEVLKYKIPSVKKLMKQIESESIKEKKPAKKGVPDYGDFFKDLEEKGESISKKVVKSNKNIETPKKKAKPAKKGKITELSQESYNKLLEDLNKVFNEENVSLEEVPDYGDFFKDLEEKGESISKKVAKSNKYKETQLEKEERESEKKFEKEKKIEENKDRKILREYLEKNILDDIQTVLKFEISKELGYVTMNKLKIFYKIYRNVTDQRSYMQKDYDTIITDPINYSGWGSESETKEIRQKLNENVIKYKRFTNMMNNIKDSSKDYIGEAIESYFKRLELEGENVIFKEAYKKYKKFGETFIYQLSKYYMDLVRNFKKDKFPKFSTFFEQYEMKNIIKDELLSVLNEKGLGFKEIKEIAKSFDYEIDEKLFVKWPIKDSNYGVYEYERKFDKKTRAEVLNFLKRPNVVNFIKAELQSPSKKDSKDAEKIMSYITKGIRNDSSLGIIRYYIERNFRELKDDIVQFFDLKAGNLKGGNFLSDFAKGFKEGFLGTLDIAKTVLPFVI